MSAWSAAFIFMMPNCEKTRKSFFHKPSAMEKNNRRSPTVSINNVTNFRPLRQVVGQ